MRTRSEKIQIEFEVTYDEVEWNGGWIPKTVYKYRDWLNDKHKRIITNSAIWIPDSYDFNDPFDCNIPIAYELIANDDSIAEKFIRKLVTNNSNRFGSDIETEIQKRLSEKKHKDLGFISEYKKEILHSNKKVNGVFSSTPVNNNILMWSHYANSHKGFCVGFDSIKLFEYLGGGGNVSYTSKFPQISPVDDRELQYTQQVLTKSIHWAYEVEYRLTTFQKTNLEIEIPAQTIVEIIFGANMPEENMEQIKFIIKDKLPHVKCYKVLPDDSNFKLNIVPI